MDLQEDTQTKIIAVSKTYLMNDIQPLIQHDHKDFGENKIQEAINKWSDIKEKNPQIKKYLKSVNIMLIFIAVVGTILIFFL